MADQLLLLLFSLFITSILYLIPHFIKRSSSITPFPVLGHLPQAVVNRHRLYDFITEALSTTSTATVTFHFLGGTRGVITANPANVEHLLRTSFNNYPKGPKFISHLHDFLGRGIFNADGPLWYSQRKTASFEFNTRSLRTFSLSTVRHHTISRLLPLLANSAARPIDLQDVLERFAFDNICKIAFGVDPACSLSLDAEGIGLASGLASAFGDATYLSAERFRCVAPWLWKVKRLLNVGSERRLAEAIAIVRRFATQIIHSRKKQMKDDIISSSSVAEDLLSRFIAAGDASEEYLRDIVISFILAGRDTTSSALTWFFWLLSTRPEVEQRILAEIQSVRNRRSPGSRDEAFEFEELREMQYLHAAITEAMRLYPPVPLNTTACIVDDVLPDGTEVRKGDFAWYSSYSMGRMELVWGKDCREYRPERWLDGTEEGGGLLFRPESPFKYPVFHAGPRMCLGKEMAYIQMKFIVACVLERFAVDVLLLDKDACPQQLFSLTLRIKGGLPVTVRERKAAGNA